MSLTLVFVVVFIYISLLFGIARWADQQSFIANSWVRHPWVYALALGVYCTSWTFYGLVGTAASSGWNFFPILLGPMLLFTFGYPILERIRVICRQEYIHSIADFIASRYGKRQGVAATVSLVVLLATIPYIALQLKAVSDSLMLIVGEGYLVSQDLTFLVAVSMILFAQLFGAKRLDVSGYHAGLVTAIAFESVVKVVVLLLVACFAVFWLSDNTVSGQSQKLLTAVDINESLLRPPSWVRFLVDSLLSMCAIVCLPRMFHVTFVECLSRQHLRSSRWIFVSYLVLISCCILLIARTGNIYFFSDARIDSDFYLIALPLAQDVPWLAMLAFLGGFSAATAMIIVASVTLSQMLSNDVILPLLVRRRKNFSHVKDFSHNLIFARRATVVLVVLLAFVYQILLAENAALTSIGLIAFALIVQLAPAIGFGLYWRKGNVQGLYAGLIIGLLLWFYTLMIPLLAQAGFLGRQLVEKGLLGIGWLRPENLFGLSFTDHFSQSVILSLGANIVFYCLYSLYSKDEVTDRIQAFAFTGMKKNAEDLYEDIVLDDLYTLVKEFLGDKKTDGIFSQYQQSSRLQKQMLVTEIQKLLAGTVGVASAQAIIESLRSNKKMAMDEVAHLFGKTTKALRFNQEVLVASFENMSSGISVVDQDLCLVAWNKRYEQMFDYPEGKLCVGLHVSDIMRFNGKRGLLGDGDIDELVSKRLNLMSAGNSYRVVRHHNEFTTIEIKGSPLPNGGYVTTYDDISEFITAQRQLEDINNNLEKRVQERTETIESINKNLLLEIDQRKQIEGALRQAKIEADEANASKTKFLALAGHDLMQPLNAANLYASALSDRNNPTVIHQLRQAIQNTESIISSLLEVSKLDTGRLETQLEIFSLNDLLTNLVSEARIQCPDRLQIKYCKTSLVVKSDKRYLRRIVQNFIANAVKYTGEGKVLVGCRRHLNANTVEIMVLDNGPGIAERDREEIFDDFFRATRIADRHKEKIPGAGLGLAVVRRFSELLEHPVNCHSQLHKGSCFSVTVPRLGNAITLDKSVTIGGQDQLHGVKVIYVDDDPHNLAATSALLHRWRSEIISFDNVQDARKYAKKQGKPDVLLMDYQLGHDNLSGLDLAIELVDLWLERFGQAVPVCIVSAATEAGLSETVTNLGFQLLRKPVRPAKMRALLAKLAG